MRNPKWGYTHRGDRRHVITRRDAFAALCGPRLVDKIGPEHLSEWVPCDHCVNRGTQIVICGQCNKRLADKGYIENPFEIEIHDNVVLDWFCSECYDDSLGSI